MAISKSTPGSQQSLSEREQEVRRAEQEVVALEGQQAAEVSRLETRAGEVRSKLQQFKGVASRAGLEEAEEPEAVGLQQRLEIVVVPRPDFSEPREQVLEVRLEAARARAKAGERLRQALATYDAQLSQLVQQLAADEQVLRRHQARRDQEAARRAREAKQRATEEATARELRQRTTDQTERQARTEPELPAVAPPPPRSAVQEARSSRVRMQASIDLQSESNFFQGFSTNLSEGGLFVATVQMLPRGTQVDLHFTLPGGRKVAAKGVVRWTREANDRTPDIFPGVGVQFVDLSSEATDAIREFVGEREPLFFPD